MKPLLIRLYPAIVSVLLLTHCAYPIQIEETTSVTIPEQYMTQTSSGTEIKNLQNWWTLWQDPQLNQLIDRALTHNYTLKAAEEHYLSALSMYDLARSDLGPQVGVTGNIGQVKLNSLKNVPPILTALPLQKDEIKFQRMGIQASWAPDIFGQKQSDKDAAYHASLSVKEKIHGAQTLITGQLAQAYFEYQTRLAQKQLLNTSIEHHRELLRYARGRFQAGQAKITDQDEIRLKIDALLQDSALIDAQITILQHLIATLSGQTPESMHYMATRTHIVPPVPRGMQPSDLLYRRADLRARKSWIDVKTAQLASAKLDLLPRFNIHFMLLDGKIGIHASPDLGLTGSLLNFDVQLPIFMSGRIKNNIKRQQHELMAAIHEFDDNLLLALREVESAYTLRNTWDKNIRQQEQAVSTAENRAKNSKTLYQTGEITYQDVIVARLMAVKEQNQYLENQLQAQLATISLYQALGGGWTEDIKE